MPSSSATSSSAGVISTDFKKPEHVGEPQPDEADAPLLDGAQDVLELTFHTNTLRPATRASEGGGGR